MTSAPSRLRVVRQPAAEAVCRLETFVARMERRYECSSELMLEAVREGRARETAEVARWLMAYRNLGNLREALARDSETGSRTNSTR